MILTLFDRIIKFKNFLFVPVKNCKKISANMYKKIFLGFSIMQKRGIYENFTDLFVFVTLQYTIPRK